MADISPPLQKDNSTLYYKLDDIFEVLAVSSIGCNVCAKSYSCWACFPVSHLIYYRSHYHAIMDDSN